jgi:hypothetical protein
MGGTDDNADVAEFLIVLEAVPGRPEETKSQRRRQLSGLNSPGDDFGWVSE